MIFVIAVRRIVERVMLLCVVVAVAEQQQWQQRDQ